jgi:YVTN family beta-propeller protein
MPNPRAPSRRFLLVIAAGLLGGLALILQPASRAQADTALPPIGVGTSPQSVVVNPVTNKIYVANTGSNTVTVIDGATQFTTTVDVGSNPQFVALNPATNRVYVTNQGSNNVTVIDGETNATGAVGVGISPTVMAVNPVTNKVYVTNDHSNDVTVIDGATLLTATVGVGIRPFAVAVNPITNKIYVANLDGNAVTVIDGAINVTATVRVGPHPCGVAINMVTNKIYVSNLGDYPDVGSVTVIDGATLLTTTVAVGIRPWATAVNPVTNKVYIADYGGSFHGVMPESVVVIDGATNVTTTVGVGYVPAALALNPVTNKIYVSNQSSNTVTMIDGVTLSTTTMATGTFPGGVAVNPITNRVYVANMFSNTVTVIDGASNGTATISGGGAAPIIVAVNAATNRIYMVNEGQYSSSAAVIDGWTNTVDAMVAVGYRPRAMAVNPVTNKIYITNEYDDSRAYYGNTVTVIDGATNLAAKVVVGLEPYGVAVNPVTNKIYVANGGGGIVPGSVTVIDGATLLTTTVAVGAECFEIAVNPVTNKVYVGNYRPNTVTVIDGATNVTTTIPVGQWPAEIAVNSVTNKIYVANNGSPDVTVIDGATNLTTTVPVGSEIGLAPIAVNSVTNKVYVVNYVTDEVTVIDGATLAATTIAVGGHPDDVAINPATNQVYVTNGHSDTVTVIDGATNVTTTVAGGTFPDGVAVNPATNKVYVISNNVMRVMGEPYTATLPLSTAVTPLPGNVAITDTPAFTFTATSAYTPTAPAPQNVFYQLDTWTGQWLKAVPGSDSTWLGATPALQTGVHILYAFATDGQEATTINTGAGSSPIPGSIAAYLFLVSPGPDLALTQSVSPASAVPGETITYTLAFANNGSFPASGVMLTDIVPVSVTVQSIINSGVTLTDTGANPAYAWQVQDLAPGQGSIITITGQLSATLAAGLLTNTAELSTEASEAHTANNSASASLTVLPANTALDLAASTNASVYGQAITLTATVSVVAPSAGVPGGLVIFYVDGVWLGSQVLLGGGATLTVTQLRAATQVVSATYGGESNFALSTNLLASSLTVDKAPLTVTAENQSRPFGAINPTLAYIYAGFVNGEGVSALSGNPVLTTTATGWSPIGTYPITIAAGSLSAVNYKFSFVDGTLTVTGKKVYLPFILQ